MNKTPGPVRSVTSAIALIIAVLAAIFSRGLLWVCLLPLLVTIFFAAVVLIGGGMEEFLRCWGAFSHAVRDGVAPNDRRSFLLEATLAMALVTAGSWLIVLNLFSFPHAIQMYHNLVVSCPELEHGLISVLLNSK